MAINFPSAPVNGQLYTENGITYEYNSSDGRWDRVPSTWINDGSFVYYDGALNVGVGTQTPGSKFTVNGTFNSTGVSTFDNNLIVDTDTLFVNVTNDRVGINTAAPTEALDVDGNVTISRSDSPTLRVETTANSSNQSNLVMQGARTTTSAIIARHQYINNLSGGAVTSVDIQVDGDGDFDFVTGAPTVAGNEIWHAGNDGAGSGLDADTLDGIQASSFVRGDNNNNGATTIRVDDADFIVSDSTDGTTNYIWRDFSAGALYLGTPQATPTTRSDLVTNSGETYWHSGNDGAGSGLDADTLDGVQAGSFLRSDGQDTVLLNDSVGNVNYNGWFIDYNLTGADVLTADRTHVGIRIDVDSSASGGDTANEHRIYSQYITTDVTGDSDLIYSSYNYARAAHPTGQVTSLAGTYSYGRSDANGTVSALHGALNYALAQTGSGVVTNLYGSHNRADIATGKTVTTARGVYAEVKIDGILTTARAVEAIIDYNSSGVSNSYLFFGDTQGSVPGNVWGVYLNDLNDSAMGPITVGSTAAPAVGLDIRTTDAIQLASGTTAQRPAATNGMIRYNSDLNDIEGVINGTWTSLSDTGSAGVGDTILPSADNVGTIGDASFTWNSGHFTNFQVDSVLTVRNRIDLADNDRIDFGSSDDAELYYDGTNNTFELELEAAATAFLITDNGTTRFTFTKSSGNLTATSFTGSLTGNASTASTLQTARTITLSGDVTGSTSFNGGSNVTITTAVANDSHTHDFANLTNKTLGTGDYSTTGDIVAGRGNGSIAMTVTDGYGNANLTFNHQNGVPDSPSAAQSAARIESSVDSNTASLSFELGNSTTQNTAVALTQVMSLTTSQATFNVGMDINGFIREEIFTLSGTSGVVLSAANGTIQTHTLTANTSYTDSLANGDSILLMIDDGANRTVTWPAGIVWVNNSGSAPTLATTGYTVISLWHVGGVLYGALVGDGS